MSHAEPDWAAGLEPAYIEGAFERALRGEGGIAAEIKSIPLTIEADDAEIPMRLMASSTLVPGLRRRVVDGVLRGADVVLTVDGVDVPIRRTAIAEALLGAPVVLAPKSAARDRRHARRAANVRSTNEGVSHVRFRS